MKFVMSYSCGKDSTLALHHMIRQGNEPAALEISTLRNIAHGVKNAVKIQGSELFFRCGKRNAPIMSMNWLHWGINVLSNPSTTGFCRNRFWAGSWTVPSFKDHSPIKQENR